MNKRFNTMINKPGNLTESQIKEFIKQDIDDKIIPIENTDENVNMIMGYINDDHKCGNECDHENINRDSIAAHQIDGTIEMYSPYRGDLSNNAMISTMIYEIAKTALYYSKYEYTYNAIDELYKRIYNDWMNYGNEIYKYIQDKHIEEMAKEGLINPIIIEEK